MKKITLFIICLLVSFSYSQQKQTGVVGLSSNTSVNLLLDNGLSEATLTLVGPNDRWFALQFGSFEIFDGGMLAGKDVVYFNGSILVDAVHNGLGITPSTDSVNNWILVSNVNNSPSSGQRTIVYKRTFNTGDDNDYVFNYADSSIDFAWAKHGTAGYTLEYHGNNRGFAVNRTFTTLGVEDFSLDASKIYPNPACENFTVKTVTTLDKINIYSQIGAFVKSIEVNNNSDIVEVVVDDLPTGVYLLELQNASQKVWKKVIIE